MRKTRKLLLISLFLLLFSTTALAHQGRTDSSGGHKDNRNKSGLGSYHYHCGGYPAHLHRNGYCPYTDVFPKRVKVKVEKSELRIGEKISIEAMVSPSNSCSTYVSWESTDTDVVRVKDGMLEAVGYGTAAITATTFNGKAGTVKITVKKIEAEDIKIVAPIETECAYIGKNFLAKVEIFPENVDDPTVIWSSSDEDVAAVSTNGYVNLRAPGVVTISATASNGVEGKLTIDVQEKSVEGVVIQQNDFIKLLICDEYDLSATVFPQDASYPMLVWKSSDESVAAVSANGHVKAVGCGRTTISATSVNGITDSINLEVIEVVAEKIEIDGLTSILIGEETTLRPVFFPEDTTIQSVEWKTSDTSIASINSQGVITAKAVGTVIVTVEGKDVRQEMSFEVRPRLVEDIVIVSSAGEKLFPGESAQFIATVQPENATFGEITWTSSSPKIAEIDERGNLKAKFIGTVTIAATSGDGYSENYTLHIVMRPQSIAFILCGCLVLGSLGVIHIRKKRMNKQNV